MSEYVSERVRVSECVSKEEEWKEGMKEEGRKRGSIIYRRY